MKNQQLRRFARKQGYMPSRNGGRHEIWVHPQRDGHVTIPYNVKDYVGKMIIRQLS